MPRKIIKRLFPHHDKIREHKHLQFLGPLLHDPNLLHLNRRSISGAFAVGMFMGWVPVPFQMVLAAIAAIIFRVNLPISVVLVWFTNPVTMPPMFYFAYKLGAWILNEPATHFTFELSFQWLSESLHAIWEPFLLGCFTLSVASSLIGYLAIRALWRVLVIQSWKERKQTRLKRKQRTESNLSE
jgi:uncharacterized protein (DUF2062 family)